MKGSLEIPSAAHDRGVPFIASKARLVERNRHKPGEGESLPGVGDVADDPIVERVG